MVFIVLSRMLSRPNHRVYYISRDEDSAKEVIEKLTAAVQALNAIQPGFFTPGRRASASKSRVTLRNGSCCIALSSNIDAIAGKTGDVIIDEAALHKDLRRLMGIAGPATNWKGGRMWVFSTHRSRKNYFNELCETVRKEDGAHGRRVFRLTINDAIRDGLLDALNIDREEQGLAPYTPEAFLQKCLNDSGSQQLFDQEYLLIPTEDDGSQAVPPHLWSLCAVPRSQCFAPPVEGRRYFCGLDIGRMRDLTVCTVFELCDDGLFILRDMLEIKTPCPFPEQETQLLQFLAKWKIKDGYSDGTGVGVGLAETVQRRVKGIQPVKITHTSRPEYIGQLLDLMRSKRLRIPDDLSLQEDFSSVEAYTNKHGGLDFWIPSRGNRGHGDRFMSCALAVASARRYLGTKKTAETTAESTGKTGVNPRPNAPGMRF